jgi:hypothetical protein
MLCWVRLKTPDLFSGRFLAMKKKTNVFDMKYKIISYINLNFPQFKFYWNMLLLALNSFQTLTNMANS